MPSNEDYEKLFGIYPSKGTNLRGTRIQTATWNNSTQRNALKDLENTLKTLEETRDTGFRTCEILEFQTQQLHEIKEKVDHVEENLNWAQKLLRAFQRRFK
jgi:3-methyladenine DNA glycosylase AlkD